MNPGGSPPRIHTESLPSADSARTCRWRYSRSRMVSATVLSSSARLPPTSRWMRIDRTTQRKSVLPIRSAMPSSASSMSTPSRDSTSARRNSPAIGSLPSLTTVCTDCASERPADRLPAMSWSVSASWPLNASVRRPRFTPRNIQGSTPPSSEADRCSIRPPAEISRPRRPPPSAMPTWRSSHSAGLRARPAASRRLPRLDSSPLLPPSTFSATATAWAATPGVAAGRPPAIASCFAPSRV